MSDTAYYLTPDLYDLVYSDYTADVGPLAALAAAAGGPVLELCCGNGRVLLPMIAAGADADGLDRDEAMLADLRRRLDARGLRAGLQVGDMRDFALPRRYALVVIAFNSFLHNLTQEDQIATLRCCREHLAPGGRLQLEVFHPALDRLLVGSGSEALMKDIPDPPGTGRLRVHDRADDDRVEQVRRVTRRIEWVDAAGRVTRTVRGSFAIRYVWKPEMELLLRVAGFARREVRPLISGGAPAAAGQAAREGDVLLWTAWRE